VSAERPRLDVIRKSVLGCDCEQCETIRELLAVVDALFIGADGLPRTPERVIKGLLGWRNEADLDSTEWRYYDGLAKAVENLT